MWLWRELCKFDTLPQVMSTELAPDEADKRFGNDKEVSQQTSVAHSSSLPEAGGSMDQESTSFKEVNFHSGTHERERN